LVKSHLNPQHKINQISGEVEGKKRWRTSTWNTNLMIIIKNKSKKANIILIEKLEK
jgi:hypothetical protein